MNTTSSARIDVFNEDGVIIERVDASRARRLILASNATVARFGHRRDGNRRGQIARILLASTADDSLEDQVMGNPKVYFHNHVVNTIDWTGNPENCWTLKKIPSSTADLFDTVVKDILKAA